MLIKPTITRWKILRDLESVGWKAKTYACPNLFKSLFIGFKTERVETMNEGKSLKSDSLHCAMKNYKVGKTLLLSLILIRKFEK